MKKPLLLLALIISLTTQAQQFDWMAQIGGTDTDSGDDIAFDNDGNVYMVGVFWATADFNPDPSVAFNLTSAGAQDAYVVKLDSAKNFIWAIKVGGLQQDFAYTVDVNDNGEVYVCGRFRVTVDFDPGSGVNNITSAGDHDIFILKLDTNGNFVWVKTIGSAGADEVENCDLDPNGNILLCGVFSGTVDFDPNGGVQNLTSVATQDAYILKLDASGNYVWAGRFGSNPGELVYGIKTDALGDVYACGLFYGTIDFDPGAGVSNLAAGNNYSEDFVLKWTSAGAFVWANKMGNPNDSDVAYDLDLDNSGNAIVTGSFNGIADFDPSGATFNLTSAGSGDIFVAKYLSANGAFVYAKGMGGAQLDQSYAIALDPSENIYVTGFYSVTADFDPGAAVFNLVCAGIGDAFILQLDDAADFMWAGSIGGSQNDYGSAINVHGFNEVYAGGTFSYIVDFDPGAGVYLDTAYAVYSNDCYLLKLNFCEPVQTFLTANLCPGDSVFAEGAWQTLEGTYLDYYTAASGCDSIVETTVQYLFTLNISASSDTVACDGETIQLFSGVNTAIYSWSTGATTQNISVTQTGNYSVTVSKSGCMQVDEIQITFSPFPVVSLQDSMVQCDGVTVTIDAGNPGSYFLWSTAETTQMITVSAQGYYMVTVTNVGGCSATDFTLLVIYPAPIDYLGNDESFCDGTTIYLDAGNQQDASYQWSTGETSSVIAVNSGGTYSVGITVGTDVTCTAIFSKTVTVLPLPNVVANASDTSVCTGDQITLYGAGALNYSWSNGVINNVAFTPLSSNTYSVTGTDINGCVDSDSVVVIVNPLPIQPIASSGNYYSSWILSPTSGYTFQWYYGGCDFPNNFQPLVGANNDTLNLWAFPDSLDMLSCGGEFLVEIADSNGCSAFSDTITIGVLSIDDIGNEILLKISPNPFHSETLLQFDLQNPSDVELIIYNLLGEKIFVIPTQPMSAGSQKLKIELPDAASGVLMYELRVHGTAVRGKMVKE